MNKYKNVIKMILLLIIITSSFHNIEVKANVFSPEEAKQLSEFIEKNRELISNEEKESLNEIIEKMNKYIVLSQDERSYVQDCKLNVIRKKLGDQQFEEYKRLIEKRTSGAEFSQPERYRLYEIEKILRS